MSQLPPLPEPTGRVMEGAPGVTLLAGTFTADQMRAYAEQARADLLADALRYRWLRHGDNDAEVLVFTKDTNATPDSVWLPRREELDAAIDAAMKGQA